MTRSITVIGAGFSGLTTAYFLTKRGFKVRVIEKSNRVGGLLETIQTEYGIVEKAANGILSSVKLEVMAADVGVPLITTRREGRKRFIYRGKPRQLPLSATDVMKTGMRLATHVASLRPKPFEPISAWGQRVGGSPATEYLLTPALGGIYAGDPDRLSASLIFGQARLPNHLCTNKPEKGKLHGTVAPPRGMQQLTDGLFAWLEKAGVEFTFNTGSIDASPSDSIVICLSASGAADYLREAAPELSNALSAIEMLSLVTATAFYGTDSATLIGFGCLFPRDQGFRARGVLFNDWIFEGRGPSHSETWIFGGALDPSIVELNDDQFRDLIATERERLYGKRDGLLGLYVNRRAWAIPHYTVDLERTLTTLPAPARNIALVGNYLGRIGLAKLIERASVVAEECQNRLR